MIVAKTKMKKIPESCKDCAFSKYMYDYRICAFESGRICPMVRTKNGNKKYIRPKWCPLMEVKT